MLNNKTLKSGMLAIAIGGLGLLGFSTSACAQDTDFVSYIPNYAQHIMMSVDSTRVLSSEAYAIIERPVYIYDQAPQGLVSFFRPMIFDVSKVSSLAFPIKALQKQRSIAQLNPFHNTTPFAQVQKNLSEESYAASGLYRAIDSWEVVERLRGEVFVSRPDLISMTTSMLPKDRIEYNQISGVKYSGELERHDIPSVPIEKAHDLAIGVDRKYWIPRFEMNIHFAQNQLSENWHKGGHNSLNMNSRLFYELTYTKDRVKWVNNIEYKLGLFTSTESEVSIRKLQISEDLLRMNSNFGLHAAKNWFYTIDLAIRTQLLRNSSTDNELITRPFAPIIADAGIGMKYDIDKKKFRNDPFARLRFTANIAPISGQSIYAWADDIDKGRVGLRPDQKYLFRLGSSVHANLIWDFSSVITWSSRFLYTTSYKHVETEFENTLSYALTQHLSTKINISLRYDDSVILDVPKTFKNLLQYSELFSFGFAYKL